MLIQLRNETLRKVIFITLAVVCLFPFVNSPMALLGGFFTSLFIGNPFRKITGKIVSYALKISIVGLGFGMNLQQALETGARGFGLTAFTIVLVLVLAYLIGRWLGISTRLSHLMGSGTAICGGSAIAAVAPVIRASEEEMSVALGAIFLLNALGLIIFPYIGKWMEMSQNQFGLWAAVAIHDTSSVVGAGAAFGQEALETATTVKLARTLWIIPLTIFSAILFKGDKKKIKIPWFIAFFILAIVVNSYFPIITTISPTIVWVSKRVLVLTLFLVGTNLTIDKIRSVGWKPLFLAVALWVVISIVSLLIILN